MLTLGVDTGGTFTDFVLYDGHRLRTHKVLSTPDAPEKAILLGMEELGLDRRLDELSLVHGSTVATNAVLESKGVPTVFITNRGLGDMLTLGRQSRRALYDLQPPLPTPPVPEEFCLETGGRLAADGSVVEPLTEEDLNELRAQIERLRPKAVAINLLFSFRDDRFERAIAAALPTELFVSRSSQVLPEYREYERGIATWLNAWVGPLVEGYIDRLRAGTEPAEVAVMQSSGNTIEAEQAGRRAVHMLLSGPAAGLAGARFVGEAAGRERLLTFDMGGTSTDVALIDGDLRLTVEGEIGPYSIGVPMVDMHTIGAGGGSIAYVDEGRLLQVGPQSAGASPGPACYGAGGREPTVTDANVVLGRLRPDAFLGGGMRLDHQAAVNAVERVAKPLGLSTEAAAEGIIRVANEHMAGALRVMSVQRGIDPKGLTLVSFGGAGGLHVCALARALRMGHAMVPVHAGVLSAMGMLAGRRGRQLSRTVTGMLADWSEQELERIFDELGSAGREALETEDIAPDQIELSRSLDLRYAGQSYTLNIAWAGSRETTDAFHRSHRERFGHRLDLPVELVNVRVGVQGPKPAWRLEPAAPKEAPEPAGRAKLAGTDGPVDVWHRDALRGGQKIDGPALIIETVSTTFVAEDWRCYVDPQGNLLLENLGA